MTLPMIENVSHLPPSEGRKRLKEARDLHFHQRTLKELWKGAALAVPALGTMPTGLLAYGIAHQPFGIAIGGADIVAAILTVGCLHKAWSASKQQGKDVFLPDRGTHDPAGAISAVDEMLSVIRTHGGSAQKKADDAIAKLQRLRPGNPLSHLQRHGYYPSRPVESHNDRRVVIDLDDDPYETHWERMCTALDKLRGKLQGGRVLTVEEVDKTLARLIPPMRAVMRASGIDTSRIDYMPGGHVPATQKKSKKKAKADDSGHADANLPAWSRSTNEAVVEPDVLTPVEGRLNAAASMTAASLRSLMLAFRDADQDLFLGDDRTTGELVVERHLPSLVSAYAVAYDAAHGEERDQVATDFAHSLKTLRNTLEGVMAGHVQAARDLLRDQGRFIESRHTRNELTSLEDEA